MLSVGMCSSSCVTMARLLLVCAFLPLPHFRAADGLVLEQSRLLHCSRAPASYVRYMYSLRNCLLCAAESISKIQSPSPSARKTGKVELASNLTRLSALKACASPGATSGQPQGTKQTQANSASRQVDPPAHALSVARLAVRGCPTFERCPFLCSQPVLFGL